MAIIKTSPIRIPGKWRKGYALDFHIVRSELVGYDHLGREKFDTQRTELGEALFKLKYRNKQDFVEPLATAAAEFIRSKHWQLDYMLAAPPSNQRAFQPVLAVAMALSQQLALPFLADGIIKVKNTGPLKDIFDYHKRLQVLENAYQLCAQIENLNILLFDDLFRSGATLNAITELLYSHGKAAQVYALTLTRTRSKQ